MSSDSETKQQGMIGELADNLGALFRHIVPGVLIIVAAKVVHPSWFMGFDPTSRSFLAVAAVVAIAIGNALFSLNRYVIHQVVDYICWRIGLQGPARDTQSGYIEHLAKYVREALVDVEVPPPARKHVAFRAASVFVIYTLAELAFLAAFWSECDSITFGHKLSLFIAAVLLFSFGVWQTVITRRIDAAVLHKGLVK